jgi:hypothetical protein
LSLLARRHNAEGKPERDTAQASESLRRRAGFLLQRSNTGLYFVLYSSTVPYILSLQSMLDVLV